MEKEIYIKIMLDGKILMLIDGEKHIGTEIEITWLLASMYAATFQCMKDFKKSKGIKITFERLV